MIRSSIGACLLAAIWTHAASSLGEELWEPGSSTTSDVGRRVEGELDEPSGDGVYGRFDGNVDVALYLGAQFDASAALASSGITAHYFQMAGVFVTYADAFGAADARRSRILSTGVDIRPVFIPRWSQNLSTGHGVSDLLVDSISLELGAYWATPREKSFGSERGFEASAGFGIPLTGRAPGPWVNLRGLLRWPDPSAARHEPFSAALLTLSWHLIAEAPLHAAP